MKATQIPLAAFKKASENWTLDPLTGCKVSRYAPGSHGYPQLTFRLVDGTSTGTLIHRLVWMFERGPIPDGMTVDHMCKNKFCCNVEHLRLLTNHENARRTSGRDWPIGRCVNGHPNSDLYAKSSGKRVCRSCNRAWQAKYRAKRKALRSDQS